MDAGAAWIALTNGDGLGVRTGNRQCFITSDRLVECDAGDDSDDTILMNHSEFLSEFATSRFRYIETQDMA